MAKTKVNLTALMSLHILRLFHLIKTIVGNPYLRTISKDVVQVVSIDDILALRTSNIVLPSRQIRKRDILIRHPFESNTFIEASNAAQDEEFYARDTYQQGIDETYSSPEEIDE